VTKSIPKIHHKDKNKLLAQFNTEEIINILIKGWYTKLIIKDKYVIVSKHF